MRLQAEPGQNWHVSEFLLMSTSFFQVIALIAPMLWARVLQDL